MRFFQISKGQWFPRQCVVADWLKCFSVAPEAYVFMQRLPTPTDPAVNDPAWSLALGSQKRLDVMLVMAFPHVPLAVEAVHYAQGPDGLFDSHGPSPFERILWCSTGDRDCC